MNHKIIDLDITKLSVLSDTGTVISANTASAMNTLTLNNPHYPHNPLSWHNSGYNGFSTNHNIAAELPTVTYKQLTVDGVDVGQTLKTICERLSILQPDPIKLEKYAALKKAYEEYKLLEALCSE